MTSSAPSPVERPARRFATTRWGLRFAASPATLVVPYCRQSGLRNSLNQNCATAMRIEGYSTSPKQRHTNQRYGIGLKCKNFPQFIEPFDRHEKGIHLNNPAIAHFRAMRTGCESADLVQDCRWKGQESVETRINDRFERAQSTVRLSTLPAGQ